MPELVEKSKDCASAPDGNGIERDLMDMAVHDMRIPLSTMLSGIQMLIDLSKSNPDGDEMKILSMARSSGEMLMQMVNDLLDISKAGENRLVLRKQLISVNQLIEQSAGEISLHASEKNVEINAGYPDTLLCVYVDGERILRVMANLLSNALRHTPPGGSISISAAYDNTFVTLTISDTGEGIPEDLLAKIFDKYVQSDDRRSARGSSGLGLAFCKLMVEAHGGEIRAESTPGEGSMFHFTLPLSDFNFSN